MDSDAVFHPSHNLACSTDMDAGVCRAVLAHLEEVVAAVHAAADVIVIGDVECPVVPDDSSNQEEVENSSANLHVDDKPSVVADEGSGTDEDEDDDDGDHGTLTHTGENAMEGFQQRIIGMLKRSEDARAQHRLNFQHENSGFDAGAAYDFFKQRFMRVQEERQIVYAVCAEQPSESGVSVTEVVRLFSH